MSDILKEHREIKHQEARKKIWTNVCAEVAGAFNCKKVEVAIDWADKALEAFDERFNNQKKQQNNG